MERSCVGFSVMILWFVAFVYSVEEVGYRLP
jgi:hypothetical protein